MTTSTKWMRFKEVLITTVAGWIPTIAFGVALRKILYRTLFKSMGNSVFIENGAEFIGTSSVELGNGVYIFRGVRIECKELNSVIALKDRVCLEIGVFLRSAGENCCIEIGENTYIGAYTCLAGPGKLKIGKDCLIAANSGIFANNHNFADPKITIRSQGVTSKGIVIEDDCWIGSGVTVLDGVTIGQGSVIGAGSVVSKDIPPYSIAVGVPARVIRSRQPGETVSATHNQERVYQNGKNGSYRNSGYIPVPLSAALSEVEEAAKVSYEDFQIIKDAVPSRVVFQQLLHALLDCVRQLMKTDTIAVLLRIDSSQQLAVCATVGLEEEITTGVRIPVGHGFAGHIAACRQPMIVEDLSTVEVVSPILRTRGVHSIVGVPIFMKDKEQPIGVFHVGSFHPRHFSEDEVQVMQAVAERLGEAIEPLLGIWQVPSSSSS